MKFVNEQGIKIAPIKVKLERTTTAKYRWEITVIGEFENEVLKTMESLDKKLKGKYGR